MASKSRKTPEEKAAARKKSNANLIPMPFDEMDPERAKNIRRKGQAAQQEAKRRKKALREICAELLAMKCPEGAARLGTLEEAARGAAEERGEPLDVYEAGMLAQVARMLEGDTRAAEFVRDSAGDKPTDKMQAEATVLTAGDVALLRRLGALEGTEDPKKE
jgi:hypothetical protein